MKKIILIDTFWHGHHSMHFKFYTRALLEIGYSVVAFCSHPNELVQYITDEAPQQTERLSVFESQDPEPSQFPIGRIRRALTVISRWKAVRTLIERSGVISQDQEELIFFPHLDSYLSPYLTHHLIDSILPYSWLGLYHDPLHLRFKKKFNFFRRGPLDPDAILHSKHCLGIGVHDEGIIGQLKHKINHKPVINFPNAVDVSSPDTQFYLLEQISSKANGRKIVGLLGALGKRKGVLTLLKASQLPENKDYFFLFVGELSKNSFSSQELDEVERIIQSNPDNCFFHFEYVDGESQFNALINLCDILYVVNENYPSNSQILTLAAYFEKRVVANDRFNIGERVKAYALGVGIPEEDISKCSHALKCLLESDSSQQRSTLQPKFDEYKQEHSYEKILVAFKKLFEGSEDINLNRENS